MGTGSVEIRRFTAIPCDRRCLSPFSGGDYWNAVEKGDRHRAGLAFPRLSHRSRLGASPHFPLTVDSVKNQNPKT